MRRARRVARSVRPDAVAVQQRAPAAPGVQRARPRRTPARARSRYGHARRSAVEQPVLVPRLARRTPPRSAARGCRAAAAAPPCGRGARPRTQRTSAAASTSSSRVSGKSRPFGTRPSRGPSGRRAAGSVAIERVAPTWSTRSTSPMSMPSSSDAVATSARSAPALSRCSASSRRSRERLPWWLVTALLAQQPRRAARRCARPSCACSRRRASCGARGSARAEPLVDLLPLLVRADRGERRGRDLDRRGRAARKRARVDERARRRPRPTRKRADLVERLLRGGEADAAGAAGRRAPRAARARAPGARRACRARARGSRRRSPCATVAQQPRGRPPRVSRR